MNRRNRKDNMQLVKEMRQLLGITRGEKRRLNENFRLPENEDYDEEGYGDEEEYAYSQEQRKSGYSDEIIDAIVQIRKISIGIIAKLADNPTSEGYTFMKRVLDMSDKAMESINNGDEKTK